METVDTLSILVVSALLWELYAVQEEAPPKHLGTFSLEMEASLADLLAQYGTCEVVKKDVYKAYVLVYIRFSEN